MKTIGYASWKGGTGKTLLAFNTLERANSAGMNALGWDFDPQRMLRRQATLRARLGRAETQINVVDGDLTVEGIATLIDVQEQNQYDLIVCDLPGADNFVMDRALNAMEAILIPVNSSPYELMNTYQLVRKTIEKGWRTYLVPNNLHPTEKRKRDAGEYVEHFETPVAPVCVSRRVAHWDAAEEGLTAVEYAPKSAAATEVREYWAWLQGALAISRQVDPAMSARELAYA